MTPQQRDLINEALKPYRALLDNDDRITRKGETASGIKVRVKGRRLRFESATMGTLQFSGGITKSAVEQFVELFWYWEKEKVA